MQRRKFIKTLAAAALLAPEISRAQSGYPNHPIKMIVPFAPGGGTDTWARLVADGLRTQLNQQIVVDNRPGAGTLIGADAVAKAAPDGYTLLYNSAAQVQGPVVLRRFPYDPIQDFAYIGQLGTVSLAFVVGPAVPDSVKNIADFIAWSQSTKLNIGHFGPGSTSHAWAALLMQEAKLPAVLVAYRGDAPLSTAILSREVHGGFVSTISTAGLIKSGMLRPMATAGRDRIPSLRGSTPTFIELGYSNAFDFVAPNGLMAPGRTPNEIVNRLVVAFRNVATTPEMIMRLEEIDTNPDYLGPVEARRAMEEALSKWKVLAERLNLYVQS